MKTWKLFSCAIAMTLATSTWAYSVEENTPFAALQWKFGAESFTPNVVVGYRSVDVETNGDVSGWQGSISYDPHKGVDKLKLEGVAGDNDLQYSYGGGYSLQHRKPLVSAGVNGSHLVGGADYIIGHNKIEPYVGVTTLGDYDVPSEPVSQAQPEAYTPSTSGEVYSHDTAVNNDLQTEHFPEYKDCAC